MTNRMVNMLAGCLLLSCLAGTAAMSANPSEGYHNYEAVSEKLTGWEQAHGGTAKLETIGKSAGGRDIYVLTIAGEGPVDPGMRQGIFLGANMAGVHNAGTEAALHFIEYLLTADEAAEMRKNRIFYVAPILNPDAHDAFFATPRRLTRGNGSPLDRDLDGFMNEDGANDLNGDGIITSMRIKDSTGRMIPDPLNPYEMKRADASKGERGQYKVYTEGGDDDGDGVYNEDNSDGVHPDRNFAHAFPYDMREAGLWAGITPEAKAIMDFLLPRRNIAVSVVYGPANNFLATPQSLGGGSDTGNIKFELPPDVADYLGFDRDKKYSIDEIWDVAKNMPIVIQQNLTKDDVAQFLGVGPATKLTDDDTKLINTMAEKYKERLEKAGLDNKRKGRQYRKGGFTPWLYYQYGSMAVELDIWGIPKPKEEKKEGDDDGKLTIDKLSKMSSDDFLALGEEKIGAFMKENNVPAQYTPAAVMGMVKGGQIDPPRIAEMLKSMGAGAGGDKKDDGKPSDLQQFIAAKATHAGIAWTPAKLPDGTEVEVGGVDPFIRYNPPYALLEKPMAVHTETVMQLAADVARVAILDTKVKDLGNGVYRVEVIAGNEGALPTHGGLDKKGKYHLPIRLGLKFNDKVMVLHGPKWATSEGLEGKSGTLTGEWMIKVDKGGSVKAVLLSDHAGTDTKNIQL